MKNLSRLWCEKYRPTSLNEYVFQDTKQKKVLMGYIEQGSIPHLLLSGVQGSGKTTLSRLLVDKLNIDESDVLVINGSDENNAETVRDKIKSFVTTFAVGEFKVVRIEEFDYFTLNGQAILRGLMEDYEEVARFILTCNYENKIMPAIRSRCTQFRFKAMDKDDVAEYVAKILLSETIKFDIDTLDAYVSVGYPDIRKIVNMVQQYSIDGTLEHYQTENESGDYKFQLLEMMKLDQWDSIRSLLCENVVAEEWEEVYKFIYENLNKCPKFSIPMKWEEGIVIIADHLHKNAMYADPEINAAAMFIRLKQI